MNTMTYEEIEAATWYCEGCNTEICGSQVTLSERGNYHSRKGVDGFGEFIRFKPCYPVVQVVDGGA